jgi:hypothetical protein
MERGRAEFGTSEKAAFRRSSLRGENRELLLESKWRIAPVLTLQASGRGAFSPGRNSCLQLAGIQDLAYLSIGVTRRVDRGRVTPRYGAVSGRLGPGLCRILHTDFREDLFHALR